MPEGDPHTIDLAILRTFTLDVPECRVFAAPGSMTTMRFPDDSTAQVLVVSVVPALEEDRDGLLPGRIVLEFERGDHNGLAKALSNTYFGGRQLAQFRQVTDA